MTYRYLESEELRQIRENASRLGEMCKNAHLPEALGILIMLVRDTMQAFETHGWYSAGTLIRAERTVAHLSAAIMAIREDLKRGRGKSGYMHPSQGPTPMDTRQSETYRAACRVRIAELLRISMLILWGMSGEHVPELDVESAARLRFEFAQEVSDIVSALYPDSFVEQQWEDRLALEKQNYGRILLKAAPQFLEG